MDRVLEPELMEDPEQAKAYAQADFSESHEGFVDLFVSCFKGLEVEGAVLDLGCGPGDVACRFARRFPGCEVHGVDASPAMLAEGPSTIAGHGVEGRVKLYQGYLPDATLPRMTYPVVISNSLLHHLPQGEILWKSVRRFAAPGAAVFIMDLRRPASERLAQALTRKYAEGESPLLQRDFLNSLRAAFTVEEVESQLGRAGLSDHLMVAERGDRHLYAWGKL